MNKKIYILLILLIVSIANLVAFKYIKFDNKGNEEQILFNGFIFKDIENIEYGSYSLSNFIDEDIKCEDGICKYLDKNIDYNISEINELGKQEVKVNIIYDGKEYHKIYELNVIDTTSPIIELIEEEIEINIKDEFEPEDYIKDITDNFDSNLKDKVVVDNRVDMNKEGEYNVIFSVYDTSGNKVEKSLHVKVKKDIVTTTTKKVSNNKTTTTKGITTTTTKKSFKDKVNSIKLNPIKTRYKAIDDKIDSIVATINKNNKTNYDKLLAAYDYVMDYLSYQTVWLDNDISRELIDKYEYTYNDAWTITLANQAFKDKTGVCDSYASMFMLITRNLGFDSYFVGGQVKSTAGGTSGHAWNVIKIDGTEYVFDTQIEDSKNGKQRLVYFGKTYKAINIYSNYNIRTFNKFKECPKSNSIIKLSGGITDEVTTKLLAYNNSPNAKEVTMKITDILNVNFSISGISKYELRISYYKTSGAASEYSKESNNKAIIDEITFYEPGKYLLMLTVNDSTYGRKNTVKYNITVTE